MITHLFNKSKILLFNFAIIFILILSSCSITKEIKVNTIYDYSLESFSVDNSIVLEASKSCVVAHTTDNKTYSGVIFKHNLLFYYVALPYYESINYSTITLYDNTSVNITFVGSDLSNKICVYRFTSLNTLSVIEGCVDEISKGESVASISSYSDTNMNSLKLGIVSDVNSYYFSTNILLSEPDMGGIIINSLGQMVGFVFSYVYSSDNEELTETYSNYVKGINYAYRYSDFLRYAQNLVDNGTFTKGLMGIVQTNYEYASIMSSNYNLEYKEYDSMPALAYILSVSGSAKNAGVKAGTFVYSVCDTLVYRTTDVSHLLALKKRGDIIKLKTIDYNKQISEFSITLS